MVSHERDLTSISLSGLTFCTSTSCICCLSSLDVPKLMWSCCTVFSHTLCAPRCGSMMISLLAAASALVLILMTASKDSLA